MARIGDQRSCTVRLGGVYWSGNLFVVRPRGAAANEGSAFKVRFERFRSGRARAVWLEFFDPSGLGTFRR